MKYNKKKKYQIAMRRFYSTNTPSKEIAKLLGIDKQGFIEHINRYLLEGMTIDNFGKIWSLDHIVPVELFDFENINDLELCYNFINIMPMFINDNRLKGASVHFSIQKLKHLQNNNPMYTNVCNKLIQKCNNEIEKTYNKCLV